VKRPVKLAIGVVCAIGAAALIAPHIAADQYGHRLELALERSLGRQVDIGSVHFALLPLPALTVDRVTIHEDPAIGIEPVVYIQADDGGMEVRPALSSLLGGKFVIASITLKGATVNLTKSGPAAEWGRWNFASLVNRRVMTSTPAIHVRGGRINFKFGDEKSVVYLNDTDLDISPPLAAGRGWRVECSAEAARTDRANTSLGSFTLKGRWYVDPERVDMDLILERSGLGELATLFRGQPGDVHGTVSSRLHLGGPIGNIGMEGRLTIEDVHRWDLLPPKGQGWPLDIRGRLDLLSQQVEMESSSAGSVALPLTVRFRATDYLTQPHWAVEFTWNRFPVGPLVELARHMGAQMPPRLELGGSIDGALTYSGRGSLQGEVALHDGSVTIPDSPPLKFQQAQVLFDRGHARLVPAVVETADQDRARIDADYDLDGGALNLTIGTDAMKVSGLRAQVALAAVPWLDRVESGQWGGELRYRYDGKVAEWQGDLHVSDAHLTVPGLADPLVLASAHATIDGARVVLDKMDAQAGKLAFAGEYRYEPDETRPHRMRLRAAQVDAGELEAELAPALHRDRGLIARALGRSSLPEWLEARAAEGTVQIDDLAVGGTHVEGVRGRVVWDGTHLEVDGVQAKVAGGVLNGRLAVNLRAARPVYRFSGKMKGMPWQSGKLDADGDAETSGTGLQLLANLTGDGTFSSSGVDFGGSAPWKAVAGTYSFRYPKMKLSGITARTGEDSYTGTGATQDDGKLLLVLSDGNKEMRLTVPR